MIDARFKPLPDITVYDLAVILAQTMKQPIFFSVDQWKELPLPIKRHFEPLKDA